MSSSSSSSHSSSRSSRSSRSSPRNLLPHPFAPHRNSVPRNSVPSPHSIFIRKLLQFWSATTQLKIRNTLETENAGYKILYFVNYDTTRFPQSHTCSNTIDFWGFPDDVRSFDDKKEFLYNKLHFTVFNTLGIDNQ